MRECERMYVQELVQRKKPSNFVFLGEVIV